MLQRIFILLFSAMALTSCFIAPGMKMRPMPAYTPSAPTNDVKPTFVPITVSLVQYMNKTYRDRQDDAYYYRIGPHDVLNIHVWGHQELNGPLGQAPVEGGTNANPSIVPTGYLVSPDGTIYFPMVGPVAVGGKTVEQARIEITHYLKKYIRNPQLDVRVTGFRSKKIYVMGEVEKPGLFPITDSPMSITDAINLAGGLIPKSADPSHIFVIRGDYARPTIYWLNAESPDSLLLGENFRLRAQDVIFVSTAGVARWNRAIEQILPSIQTLWFTATLFNQVRRP